MTVSILVSEFTEFMEIFVKTFAINWKAEFHIASLNMLTKYLYLNIFKNRHVFYGIIIFLNCMVLTEINI